MFTYNNEKQTDKFRNGKAACLAFTFVNEHNNDHSPMVIKARTGFQYICLSYKEYCIYAMSPQNQNHITACVAR